MKLKLIWTGKISERPLKQLADRFEERIRQYLPLEIVEVRPEKSRSRSDGEIITIESQRLTEALPAQGKVVAMDERGKEMSSTELAGWLEKETVHNPHGVAFVMGGDLGLSDEIRSRAGLVLALSQMTLPHELARVVLLEQLYRACTIIRNIPYHK